jgi:hypothetical protein
MVKGRHLPFRRREGRLRDGDVHGGQIDRLPPPSVSTRPNLKLKTSHERFRSPFGARGDKLENSLTA